MYWPTFNKLEGREAGPVCVLRIMDRSPMDWTSEQLKRGLESWVLETDSGRQFRRDGYLRRG